ncbi:Crp/Fnr family transcriptional regulator [Chitinophaga sp. HK235]|uniref:Crp/Fnr family transcriptional regulator n=1 Tax=Chitinophaga sp. HK235 TaxID=2952571 RepID=UPI001BABF752|nr:Crp/Fnr family transcriptional regulator [Chitinophaga sp. HK235]
MPHDPYHKIIAQLNALVHLDEEEQTQVRSSFEPVHFPRRTILVKEGSISRYMYFINSGYLRTYYVKEGLEVTNHINCPTGFITAFSSYITGTPSYEYLECITACELLRIPKEKLDALFVSNHKWAEAGRIINENVVLYNEQRTRDIISKTAEERYLQLLEEHPDYVHHVPLQYIASFIGVKPESLSRIRRTLQTQG